MSLKFDLMRGRIVRCFLLFYSREEFLKRPRKIEVVRLKRRPIVYLQLIKLCQGSESFLIQR